MMKKRFIIILIICSIILISCEKAAKFTAKNVPLKDAKYLISFSGSDMNQFSNSISVLYEDGSVKEIPVNTSMVLENAIENQGEYYFYSRQKNIHYRMKDGRIEQFSIMEDVYSDGYYGVLNAYPTKNGCIQILNIGVKDGVYVTDIVRTSNDMEELIYNLENKLACSVTTEGDLLHIAYIDLKTEKPDQNSIGSSGIMTLDMESKRIIADTLLPNQYRVEPDRPIVGFDGAIIVYSQELTEEGIPTDKSYIAAYKEGRQIKELVVENFNILESYVHDNKLYLFGDGGMIKIYDSNYQIIADYNLKIEDVIRKIYFKDNYVFTALYGNDYKMYIHKYNLDSGISEEKFEVPYPTVIDWEIENFTFIPNP
nr:hypothetical protein [uncultured Anaerocolumna sp.]